MRRSTGIVLIACFALGIGTISAAAYELTDVDRAFLEKRIIAHWEVTGRGQVAEAYRRGIDILEDHPDLRKGYFPILVNAAQLNKLLDDGFKIHVQTYDHYRDFAAKSTDDFGGFRTGLEIEAYLDSIHAAHPTITTAKTSIGLTWMGNHQYYMKISDNPEVDEDEPEVFFNGLHHAREPISAAVLLETIARLVDGYGVDTFLTRLVNEREIYFMPMVNPDGYVYNQIIAPNGGGLWRKNRNPNQAPIYGVDPNRNYGYMWGYDDEGSSPHPSGETYRGTGPFSEPETANIRAFTNSREFVFVLNYHSVIGLYLWALSYDYDLYTPDEDLFQAVADSMGTFNGYPGTVGWVLYPTNGDADDWNYAATDEHSKILSFTPEVGGSGFWPNPSEIPGLIEENQGPNFLIMDLADDPQRIFPPAVPMWLGPDEVDSASFNLSWSDPGGPEPAVAFRLREVYGVTRTSDDAESGDGLWSSDGFSLSTGRSASGIYSYFGGATSSSETHLYARQPLVVEPGDTIRLNIWYNIEANWDYAYVEASTDGGRSWVTLPGSITTTSNPNGNNRGHGITGASGSWVSATFPLDSYVGQGLFIRLSYSTDQYTLEEGVYFDDIAPLVDLDSIIVIADHIAQTSYYIMEKENGTYWYDLTAYDDDGQISGPTAYHEVTVNASTCAEDCICHADEVCDGSVDVLDVVNVVNIAFRNELPTIDPGCPYERSDVNTDGSTDVLDVVQVVNVAFRNFDPAVAFDDPCAP
jgi:hypothetical protein